MTKDDRTLNRVFDKFVPVLEDQERLKEVLQGAHLVEITTMLDSWHWMGFPIQERMFLEEQDRRQRASEKAQSILHEAAVTYESAVPQTTPESHEQAPDTPLANASSSPSWWQEHKNQIYVGLLVGIPTLLVTVGLGILTLIIGG